MRGPDEPPAREAPLLFRPLLLCVVVSLVASAVSAQSAEPRLRTLRYPKHDVRLQVPASWEAEELAEQNVVLLMSPVEDAGWQTNVFLEARRDRETGRSEKQMISTLIENLRTQKRAFVLKHSRALVHPSGLRGTELVYTHTVDGIALTEKEIVLRVGAGRLLFVSGSAASSLWRKYEPQIDAVLGSIRPLSSPASR